MNSQRMLINGNGALAWAALDLGTALGVGYPGTPSTEILETFSRIGGRAQWSPNEKVALEVGLGAAFARARVLVTMKHVGLNVAADPLFTATYTGSPGALVLAVADDPGMASSQNEQDTRRYAIAAGAPVLCPADSQQTYDMFGDAVEIAERWSIPVILRLTTRVSHSKSVLQRQPAPSPPPPFGYERDIPARVMVPAYARPAHRRLREKLDAIREWGDAGPAVALHGDGEGDALGILADGVCVAHAREAAPGARVLQVRMPHPFPAESVRKFAAGVRRCLVVEEGDPVLLEACQREAIPVEETPREARFGEMNVDRIRERLADAPPVPPADPPGKPPQLCPGCPHRIVFTALKELDCIVAGDIGCYTLGVLPPFEAMDTAVCMGASIGVGLGLRHVLPAAQRERVVSVIGDSTFVHSGLTGIAEMVYNPPPDGHLVIVLDNETTAMTGFQEHPGTGRRLDRKPAYRLSLEGVCRAMGVTDVTVADHGKLKSEGFAGLVREKLALRAPTVIIARRPCLLAAARHKKRAEARGEEG